MIRLASLLPLALLALAGPVRAGTPDSLVVTRVRVEVELTLQAFDRAREDGVPAHRAARADLARAAVLVDRRLDDAFGARVAVAIEPDVPPGGSTVAPGDTVARRGEWRLEEAFVSWRHGGAPGVRAGLLLVPIGLLNEHADPLARPGALRNDVERRVIPAPWSALGAGIFGSWPRGLTWRACALEGLDAARFNADAGLREGARRGPHPTTAHPAFAAGVDAQVPGGLGLGVSLYTGRTWQGARLAGRTLRARVLLQEVHATLQSRGLEARALYVMGTLTDHEELTRQLGLRGTRDAIGGRLFGGYVEAGWNVAPLRWPGTRRALTPFARFEESDTQDAVGAIGIEDPSRHRTALTLGLVFAPRPGVAIKAERQRRHDELRTQTSQWNGALAFSF